jgi:hypothetical protein
MNRQKLAGVMILATLCAAGCSKQTPSTPSARSTMSSVEPGICVGKVRAGMTTQQIIAELGKPDRNTGNALLYQREGIEVVVTAAGTAKSVICGDENGPESRMVKAFTGRTKAGIGMGSTRAAVVEAYGEPTKTEQRAEQEVLWYRSKGLVFMLGGGKVDYMKVDLSNQK